MCYLEMAHNAIIDVFYGFIFVPLFLLRVSLTQCLKAS